MLGHFVMRETETFSAIMTSLTVVQQTGASGLTSRKKIQNKELFRVSFRTDISVKIIVRFGE
jgi:hypothetical protein